jgi:uncharacterized protein (TIRG00374 family)
MVRTPTSLFRLIVGSLTLAAGVVAVWRFDNAITAFHYDLRAIVDVFPQWLIALPLVVVTAVLVIAPIVVTVRLARARSFRLLGLVTLAATSAAVLSEVLVRLSTTTPPSLFPDAYIPSNDLTDTAGPVTPNDILLAGFVAALVVGLPYLNRPTRRLAVGLVGLHLVVSFAADAVPPTGWLVDLGAGITCGALVALVFGTPDSSPRGSDIAEELGRSGFRIASAERASVDARGSTPWFARTTDGRRLFVKVLDQDNRSADLMFRMFRLLTFRSSGDERPFPSLRRAVEHEALLSMRASAVGIRTPRLEAVSTIGVGGMLLAYLAIDGASLDRVPPDDLDDAVLDEVWKQLQHMRDAGIAHRDLRLANVFLGADERAWIIDFGFAELAASDLLLDTDVAELLGSTASSVGVERAVDAAERTIGSDVLGRALPRLQPFALGSATRTALRDNELFEPLRAAVQERAGVAPQVDEPLAPISAVRLTLTALATAAAWIAGAALVGERDSFSALWTLRPTALATAAVAAGVTYLGATLARIGAFRDALQFGPTFQSTLASSLANRVTPARTGGITLAVRFLQKQGVATADAVQSVGLVAVTGLLVHLLFLAVTTRIGIDDRTVTVGGELGASTVTVIAVVLASVGLGLVALVPAWRSAVTSTVVPAVRRAGSGLRAVAGRPLRLAQLLVGSIIVVAAYSSALVFSAWAVGVEEDFLAITITFLVATIVAAPAPTPGGLGVLEVALIAGLVLFGSPLALAIPAVFLYRLLTFWIPIGPGALAYRSLERAGRI